VKIQVSKLIYDPEFNCRGAIDPVSCQELADSIASIGLLNPLTVTPVGRKYKIVAGHRRYLAIKLLKWEKVEATVRKITDQEAMKINLQENLGRRDLTPTQEMRSIFRIYGKRPSVRKVAADLGKSEAWIRGRIAIQFLDLKIQADIDTGKLTASDICLILSTKPDHQLDIAVNLRKLREEGKTNANLARKHKMTKKPRTSGEIQGAITAISDLGSPPSWWSAMSWCAGLTPTEEFFGVKLERLREYGIES